VEATITRGFRRSYLLAALLGLLALVPLAVLRRGGDAPRRLPRAAVIALAVATALIGAELARGAQAFGAQPRLQPACAPPSAPSQSGTDAQIQRLALEGLDQIACRFHENREQLLLGTATWTNKARADIRSWANKVRLPFG